MNCGGSNAPAFLFFREAKPAKNYYKQETYGKVKAIIEEFGRESITKKADAAARLSDIQKNKALFKSALFLFQQKTAIPMVAAVIRKSPSVFFRFSFSPKTK